MSSWSHTLHLPRSQLANRSNAKLISRNLERVTTDLYRWQAAQHTRPTQILHDGPPYANGDLHMGHALNKVLKDIINRHAVATGRRVDYIPGWDCHGLPIEHAALKKVKKQLGLVERRELARKLAVSMVDKQKQGFIDFGVMADWQDPSKRYLTLQRDYIVRELRVFAQLVAKNLVFRQCKPVFWSVDSGTALAESELVYGERESSTIYFKYPMATKLREMDVSLAVWTTTPWTLPANQAVAVNENIEYCIVQCEGDGSKLVVAENLVDTLKPELAIDCVLVNGIKGTELQGLIYNCPLRGGEYPIITADHVVDSAGTGLVHTAPGHGKDDFIAGNKHKLPVLSPVDGRGRYTNEVMPTNLAGYDARKQGTPLIIEMLQQKGALLNSSKITHSVPLDWRTKTPVMVRATPQFFIDLGNKVRKLAVKALENVSFRPEAGKQRLQAFTESRSDWCISRQRAWGVPIPVIYNIGTDKTVLTQESIDHIINRIETEGVDAWFKEESDIEHWLPLSMQGQGLGKCYRKGQDTLDVWLDSGTSWTMLDQTPVDFYLEGSDQHRGWFQSSLLTHVAVTGKAEAPFKRLITHGFVLDENRQKMSKSLGNTVEPAQLIKTLGIDGLRLLIAQSDYTSDITLSQTSTTQVAAMIKKFRLTFKYLLGNLADYEGGLEINRYASVLDLHAINKLNDLIKETRKAFDEQNFQHVVKLVQIHMNSELSSLYFDAVKDVLYTDAKYSDRRIAVQSVLINVLNTYVRLMAPLTPLLTQEVWDLCPKLFTKGLDSPLMAGFPTTISVEANSASETVNDSVKVRETVNDAIEKARGDKKVGSSLACDVYIESPTISLNSELMETICIASQVYINKELPADPEWIYQSEESGVKISILPPSHVKCPRCWKYTAPVEGNLCDRCEEACT